MEPLDDKVLSDTQKSEQSGWVLLVGGTFLANLLAVLAVPKLGLPTNAGATLPLYGVPVVWAGVVLFSYRRSPLRWLSYLAGLSGLFWFLQVAGEFAKFLKS
jgi:hypothetical protein